MASQFGLKSAIKQGAAVAAHPLKKVRASSSSRASSGRVEIIGTLFLPWCYKLLFFLEADCPSAYLLVRRYHNIETDSDEQGLGVYYSFTFHTFLASGHMRLWNVSRSAGVLPFMIFFRQRLLLGGPCTNSTNGTDTVRMGLKIPTGYP